MRTANLISIFGYGSLTDIQSARSTLPSAENFRKGRLEGYRRSYNLVSIGGIKSGSANLKTLEMAALSIHPSDSDSKVLGCLFDVDRSDLEPYKEREHRYNIVQVMVHEENGHIVNAYTVVQQTDEEYKQTMSESEYYERVGQYYSGSVWGRTDILPMRDYMKQVNAAQRVLGGQEYVDNMLEDTLLADGVTTLKQYLQSCSEISRL
eukprot:CAMPEP_0182428414 /NCGR_PEP_ID=MMETSP1167-20130531/22949_1 /TAXON_ID=2988 /ORGANISM="Mallomonas Sp, Strain CCMP3275" /LENGTH=206 /DNA_ID=CAMNT_0024611321 /DNA_START=291 /DNA_END=911 /DNA_ORIENTATION=-